MTRKVASDFIMISVVYFLIGIFWMGILFFLGVSGPSQPLADQAYHWAMFHVMLIGWASFAIIGGLYYIVPRIAGKEEMASARLGAIHFWVTNITFPIGLITITAASFLVDSLQRQGLSESQIYGSPAVAPYLLTFLAAVVIAFAAQFVFAYNVYKTMRG